MTQASESVRLTIENGVFHSKAGFVSGTPIFVGTRVPLKNLFDYLAGGYNLDEFLDDFPSVSPSFGWVQPGRISGRLPKCQP